MLSWILLCLLTAPTVFGQTGVVETTLHEKLGNAFRSLQGRAFPFFETKTSGAQHRFLIQSGIHGNEQLAPEFVLWLKHRYDERRSPLNRLNAAIDFLPAVNPDGLARGLRTNGRGVNINRNFDVLWGITKEFPGLNPFSEPETQAVKALFEQKRYDAAIDVHGYINWIVMPSDLSKKQSVDATLAHKYRLWTDAVVKEARRLPGYQTKTAGELGDGGAFEDWAFWKAGTMAICLELKSEERFDMSNKMFATAFGSDQFLRYEAFIYYSLTRAIKIKEREIPAQQLVQKH
jgi:predicted deacylase